MGESMARWFLKAGHRVLVQKHRNPEPVQRLTAEGAQEVRDLERAAAEADVLFSMLPNLPQIEEVLFQRGVFAAIRPGTLFLNMSTVSPDGIRELAGRLAEKGIETLDAPVSGGPVKAADGTLTIMAGGERDVFDKYLPLLNAIGEKICYTGPVGTGQIAKLCNNLLAAMIMAANAEVLTMGVKAGADAKLLREIILASTGSNRLLEDWIPKTMLKDTYEPGFALNLMYKDIELAMQLGKTMETPLFLGGITQQLYRMMMGGDGQNASSDFSVVSKCYQDAANVRIAGGTER
jgi:3-hydroxyisobutyrate dehydrogenase-like beta-hydroxyacid dehydrogenase